MRFMSHNWSATKQRLHLQSIAEISRHSVLSGYRIQQCETSPQGHRSVSVSCHSFCRHRSVSVPCENGSAELMSAVKRHINSSDECHQLATLAGCLQHLTVSSLTTRECHSNTWKCTWDLIYRES